VMVRYAQIAKIVMETTPSVTNANVIKIVNTFAQIAKMIALENNAIVYVGKLGVQAALNVMMINQNVIAQIVFFLLIVTNFHLRAKIVLQVVNVNVEIKKSVHNVKNVMMSLVVLIVLGPNVIIVKFVHSTIVKDVKHVI